MCASFSNIVYNSAQPLYSTDRPLDPTDAAFVPCGMRMISQGPRMSIFSPLNTAAGTTPLAYTIYAIRGTQSDYTTLSFSDWKTDFDLLREQPNGVAKDEVESIYTTIVADMTARPFENVIITGHSLGGFIATEVGIALMSTPSLAARLKRVVTFNSYAFCTPSWQRARGELQPGAWSQDTMPAMVSSILPSTKLFTSAERDIFLHFCMKSDWPSTLLQTMPAERLIGDVIVYETGASALTVEPTTWANLFDTLSVHVMSNMLNADVLTLQDDAPTMNSQANVICKSQFSTSAYPAAGTGDLEWALYIDQSGVNGEALFRSSQSITHNGSGYNWTITGSDFTLSQAIVDVPNARVYVPRVVQNTGVEYTVRFIKGSEPSLFAIQVLNEVTNIFEYLYFTNVPAAVMPAAVTLTPTFTDTPLGLFYWDTGVEEFHEGLRRSIPYVTPVVYNGLQALFPNPASGTAVANIKWHYNANYWYMESSSLNSQVAGNKQVYARSYGNPNPARWGIEWSDNTVLPATDEHQWIITAHNNGSFYTIQNAQYTTQFVGQWGDTAGDMSTVQSANYVQVTLDAFNNASMTLVGTSQSFEAYYRSYTVSSTDQVNYMSWNPMTSSNNSNYSTSGDYTINFEFLA